MAALAKYIADTSALARLPHPDVRHRLSPLIDRGLVATCGAVDFKMLWSTRNPPDFVATAEDRTVRYERLPIEDTDWRRALDVMEELWTTGHMRAVPLPDLLIAATAERHRVTVLHYDADYDLIAEVTGQPVEWVVPAGSVP